VTHYETHIDYITLTIPDDVPMTDAENWTALVAQALREGDKIGGRKAAQALGYKGLVAGPVFAGARQDGAILRCSGFTADKIIAIARPPTARCTRVDLALTVWLEQDDPGRAGRAREQSTAVRESDPASKVKTITFIDGCGAGDTLYLGSRTSELFGRVYDKGRESNAPEYAFAWRYEVEYKGLSARAFLAEWSTAVNRRAWELGVVLSWFKDRGIEVPVQAESVACTRVEVPKHRTDPEKTMEWLRTGVAPSVRRLLDYYDKESILKVLGLGVSDSI